MSHQSLDGKYLYTQDREKKWTTATDTPGPLVTLGISKYFKPKELK